MQQHFYIRKAAIVIKIDAAIVIKIDFELQIKNERCEHFIPAKSIATLPRFQLMCQPCKQLF